MKKIWLGIGAAVIVILLLLQTKFKIFMRLEESGYAIAGNEVKQTLMLNPEEVEGDVDFQYYRFEALDYIYQRGNKYYMGEKRKQEIDLGFPLYVNGGAGILFTGNSGTLFDVDYEEAAPYAGLVVSDKIAYNPGGSRADGTEYLFCGLPNGLFINLDSVVYEDRGEMREIDRNSIIYFTEEYFAYSEQNGGAGKYQVCRSISDTDLVTVNGEELTYHELLLRLHVITDKKVRPTQAPEAPTPTPIPTAAPTIDPMERESDKDREEADEAKEKETKEKKERSSIPRTRISGKSAAAGSSGSRAGGSKQKRPGSQLSSKVPTEQPPRGTRPDHMRPDKNKPAQPIVQDYVKPTAAVNGVTAGVYRIVLDVDVNDPARRLHQLRKVQFEFYEVGADGKETLVYRTYTGASNHKLTAGDGSIKPSTTYRVNGYFTYYDEYDNMIVESIPLDHILPDSRITTGSFDSLGVIDLGNPVPDYYYDRYLELPRVQYAEGSDEEAVYGINRSAGIKLIVEGNSLLGSKSETIIDGATISSFKNHVAAAFCSAANLTPKSQYRFTIEAVDYFGNKLTLINCTGEFETCKSRPVGNLEIKVNKLGDLQMQVNVTDPDESAIPVTEGSPDYDFYLVYSTVRSEIDPVTKEECDAYLAKGGPVEGGKAAFVYKFNSSEYLNADGKIEIDQIVGTANLDLNQRYFAYLYCDYNLNNKKGDVRFGEIANLNFTSASLSSLGDIFVKVDIANVKAHSATIAYTLNTDRTVDELEKLLSSVRFEIVRTNGEEEITDSYIQFDTDAMTAFSAYDHGTNVSPIPFPWSKAQNDDGTDAAPKSVMMDASFFDGTLSADQHELRSMTDYAIVPVIKATYNGKEYDMNVRLTSSSFKTLKEPATVEVENLLLAAGTLRFNVRINDPDGAIVGNSGHMVRMNLYQQDGTFVTALRIPKNTEDFQEIEIKDLGANNRFKLTFIAVEYNEGYSNSSYESNKILKEILINDSLDLLGSIKLQNITASDSSGKLTANVKAIIHDKTKTLSNSGYYIQVQKNGEDVTGSAGYPTFYAIGQEGNGGNYDANNQVTHTQSFQVDQGNNTYKLTLYVIVNGQRLVLDTLTFTTEQPAEGIGSAEEFIWKIKANPNGKFVITDDITLDSSQSYPNPGNAAQTATPKTITSNFEGRIDFQGYELNYTYRTNGSRLFNNLGPKSDISNMVFNAKMENQSSAVWDDGVLCRINYGRIHDVMVNYKGGESAKNQYIGLLCRYNAASGIIENFVVNNAPEEGTMPFTAWYAGGLVCGGNKGIVRNGYAYGDPVFTDLAAPSRGDVLHVGGIVGFQAATGRISNVYSLVNVTVADITRSSNGKKPVTDYGSVLGGDSGRVSNAYGIGESFYNNPSDGNAPVNQNVGPAVGNLGVKTDNVYYWNEANRNYPEQNYENANQRRIGLESLYDYEWQAQLLGGQFITSNVEVGYYPHVVLSDELPGQPYLPLPDRAGANLIELISAEVAEYVDDQQAAIIKFNFSNTQNAEIQEIHIENLTTEIDVASVSSADGFTTLLAKVSNPTKYCSSYAITGVDCYLRGKRSVSFDPNPLLLVDFYRNISTPEEWYQYVVMAPTENARLTNDIDFTGVASGRIVVTNNYSGKLDGGSADAYSPGFALKNITLTDEKNYYNNVFSSDMTGEITNLCVENLALGTGKAVSSYPGFVRLNKGIIDNVHLRGVTVIGYGYVGGLVSQAVAPSEITNSSVSGISITYQEPANSNTNGRIGGLVGSADQTLISSCYVRDLNMKVEDIRGCDGAGGLIGYAATCSIENAYVTGRMEVRGSRVGGIVGYYGSNETGNSIKNLLSGAKVSSYQDQVGGIIGACSVDYMLNARNNVSGVALGDIYVHNTQAENVSYTVGSMEGATLSFYGSETQLLNGIAGQPKDDNTLELLSLSSMHDPSAYTDLAGMDAVFDYGKVKEDHFPTLYYRDTGIELPFQSDIPLVGSGISKNEITVKNVFIDEDNTKITLEVETSSDAAYAVNAVTIEDLILQENGIESHIEGGTGQVVIGYLDSQRQEHWKDSYLLTGISYTKKANGAAAPTAGVSKFDDDPVRIPLTLYADIYDVDTWNHYINESNNCGNYENYRIVKDIDFRSGMSYTINTKLGRLVGRNSDGENGRATLKNIEISGPKTNFILRLNSEMANLCFENCTVSSSGRDGVGLVGASAAEIHDVEFKDITITNGSKNMNYTGLVAYQVGGKMQDLALSGITVICNQTGQTHVGGLTGYSNGSTLYKNITGKGIEVTGASHIGGMLGYTERADFEDIVLEDVKVTGRADYIGGIIGRNSSPQTSNRPYHMWNVSIKGTPAYDGDGRVQDSTTVIALRSDIASGTHVGGIAGYCRGYQIGFGRPSAAGENAIYVDGIVVKSVANYTGGAFGWTEGCQNVAVNDVLLTYNNRSRTAASEDVGGVSGRSVYDNSYHSVNNLKIDVYNSRHVGLLTGYKYNNSTSYCFVENSELKITRNSSFAAGSNLYDVGGLIGRSEVPVQYCGVYNSSIVATNETNNSGYYNVGGVVGYASGNVNRCFYYAEPESSDSPAAKAEYKVQGGRRVGGLVGRQYTGSALYVSYSNANVIAADSGNSGTHAGGLTGYYDNAYTVTESGGKLSYSYSGAQLYRNYFAGTVQADKCAGGAIGANSMALLSTATSGVEAAHITSGGRSTTLVNGIKSGKSNEVDYTFRNLILAKSVSAKDGSAYAFSGTQDGFEGKTDIPNHEKDKAARTFFFAGMQVNGTPLYEMMDPGSPGSYKYQVWNKAKDNPNDKFNCNANVRLVLTEDLKGDDQYQTLKGLVWASDKTGDWKPGNKTMKGAQHRLLYSTADKSDEWSATGDENLYKGKDYLPHIRVLENANVLNVNTDLMVRKQSDLKLALPIPVYNAPARASISTFSLGELPETYAIVYPVDADRVNVEFSQDLVDYDGYFTLSYGDREVVRQLIEKRVYTFSYDYGKNLTLTYGVADLEGFAELTAEADGGASAELAAGEDGGVSGSGKNIFDYEDLPEELFLELDSSTYKAAALARHVMVYGNEYYYIESGQGIVHGTGSGTEIDGAEAGGAEIDDAEIDDAEIDGAEAAGTKKSKVEDKTAKMISGDYITVYNGHALTKDGTVIDVAAESSIRSVSGLELQEQTVPMQSFGYDGYRIETYAKFAEVLSGDVVQKEAQILKGYTGNVGFVDGSMENIKDSLLLYTKDGSDYQTILGVDGIMIDMFQGDDINAPEGFKRSGIVYMTNNLNCSVPFVLVEYSNGGVVGYNYMTGEYLFDHSVTNDTDLLDYIKVYFDGDKSMYAQVNNSYAANKRAAEIIGTPERLLELVEGNTNDVDVEGNSSGNGTASESENQKKAGEDGVMTGSKTAIAEGGTSGAGQSSGETAPTIGEGEGSEQADAAQSQGGTGTEGDPSGTGGSGTEAAGREDGTQGGSGENGDVVSAAGVEGVISSVDSELITGKGQGNSDIITAGTALGNGENTTTTDSTLGASGVPAADGDADATGGADNAGGAGAGDAEGAETSDVEEKVDIDKLDLRALDEAANGDVDGAGSGAGADEEAGAGADKAGSDAEAGTDRQESVGSRKTAGSAEAYDEQQGDEAADDNAGTKESSEAGETKISTAGTEVTGGINNGKNGSHVYESQDDEDGQNNEDTSSEEKEGKLITVYNQSTGTYEIVDMEQYFNVPVYRSENQKLNIQDLSVYAGYAQEKEEKKQADGLMLYVLVAAAVIGGVGFTYYYRKKHKYK